MSPVSALTVAPQSQAVASLEVVTPGDTASLTKIVLHPRIGPNQVATLNILVNGTVELVLTLVLYDDAFESVDLFGGKKGQGAGEGEVRSRL